MTNDRFLNKLKDKIEKIMSSLTILRLFLIVLGTSAQGDFCDMCGAGQQPSNVDLIVPFLAIGENDNPSCQQVYEFGSQSVTPSDDVCSLIKSHKDFCGCPGASTSPLNNCSLCPLGATPMKLNAVTPFEDTCSELDTYLKYLPSDLCLTERVGSIMRADAFCGCPGVKAECYMCDDDSNNLSNPDRLVPFYEFMGNSFSSNCQELADFYTLYDTNDPEMSTCDFVKMEAGYCGCQSSTNTSPINACTVCSDGAAPANGDVMIDDLKMTCSQLATYMSYVPADQCEMPWIEDFQRFDYLCGCAAATAPCPICKDGTINVSNPDAIVPYLILPNNNENPTCRQLATLGVIAEPGELVLDDCSIFEAQADFCGCPESTKPDSSCIFCSDGATPPNPSLITPFGDTCEQLSEYLSYLPSDQCDSERIGFIKRQDFLCGCPSATTSCALCADHGSNAVEFADRHIPLLSLPLNTNPTCQEVVEFMSVNDGDLSDAGCSALQGYAGYCGCPETSVNNQCSFCPNGGSPSKPDKTVSDLFTCQGLDDFVSFLNKDGCSEDSNDFRQIQAFAYVCGCPDVQPNCSLCAEGVDPSKTDKLTGDSDGTTCGEFAEFVASLTSDQCIDQSSEIISTASVCGCGRSNPSPPVANEVEKCPVQQNADLCTDLLLDSVSVNCDCYAFCDSKFVKCQSSGGGLLQSNECRGTPITGCNRAGVSDYNGPSPSTDQAGKGPEKKYKSEPNTAVIVSAIVIPVILALLVGAYYYFTRNSTQNDLKMDEGIVEGENTISPPQIDAMEGSMSMADVPFPSAPPPGSFSKDESLVDKNPDSKIV